MASSSKKKTTMAKLMREQRLRERRVLKQARKDARKNAAAEGRDPDGDVAVGEPQLDASIAEPDPVGVSEQVGVSEPAGESAPLP